MLYFLGQLGDSLTAFNVFRYVTFRTAGAVVTALFFVFMFGPGMIKLLRQQMPEPSMARLLLPFGESSPMELLWVLMGQSWLYSAFAGAAEFLGGLDRFDIGRQRQFAPRGQHRVAQDLADLVVVPLVFVGIVARGLEIEDAAVVRYSGDTALAKDR